jgi:hypothetical protein
VPPTIIHVARDGDQLRYVPHNFIIVIPLLRVFSCAMKIFLLLGQILRLCELMHHRKEEDLIAHVAEFKVRPDECMKVHQHQTVDSFLL